MSNRTKSDLIHRAYDHALKLLSRRGGWEQGWGTRKDGHSIFDEEEAVAAGAELESMCLLTALRISADHVGCNDGWVIGPVRKELGVTTRKGIWEWNDVDGRKKGEVTGLLVRLRNRLVSA